MSFAHNDTLSAVGRATHDVGLSALLGGNLFARVGMHPALSKVSDPRERGAVTNAAWRRYGTVNSLSLAAVIAGWAGARLGEAQPRYLSDRERSLARAKDIAVAAVAVTGVAAAADGVRFGKSAPGGAVPLNDGNTAASGSTSGQARSKRALNALGAASLLSEVALAGINAALSQTNFRRPPARRLLKRTY
jgi:hypothetical protein